MSKYIDLNVNLNTGFTPTSATPDLSHPYDFLEKFFFFF